MGDDGDWFDTAHNTRYICSMYTSTLHYCTLLYIASTLLLWSENVSMFAPFKKRFCHYESILIENPFFWPPWSPRNDGQFAAAEHHPWLSASENLIGWMDHGLSLMRETEEHHNHYIIWRVFIKNVFHYRCEWSVLASIFKLSLSRLLS